MAHEITATDNLFTSNSKAAWHGLGTVFDGYPTKQEAYDAAFGWEPVSEPLYRKIPVITPEGELREEFEKIESDEDNPSEDDVEKAEDDKKESRRRRRRTA